MLQKTSCLSLISYRVFIHLKITTISDIYVAFTVVVKSQCRFCSGDLNGTLSPLRDLRNILTMCFGGINTLDLMSGFSLKRFCRTTCCMCIFNKRFVKEYDFFSFLVTTNTLSCLV